MAKTFLFERSFNINTNFLSWASATPGAGSLNGIDDPARLLYTGFDDIQGADDVVIIPVAIFSGQTVTIDVDFGIKSGDGSIDLQAWVIDASGVAVTQDDTGGTDLGSTSHLDPNFSFTAAETGVYFLAVTDFRNDYIGDFEFQNTGGANGSFQVNISTEDQFGIINYGDNQDNSLDFSSDNLDDRIVALGGNDTIHTGGGRNVVDAGDGQDYVYGGDASEQVFGDLGDDYIEGGDGEDVLIGGGGDDVILGGAGRDQLVGGGGVDTLVFSDLSIGVRVDLAVPEQQDTGGGLFEVIRGFENVVGSGGNDVIIGLQLRANRLEGGAGADSLDGRGQNDVLVGGTGADTLRGGTGNDTFVFGSGNELGLGRASDLIADFRHQQDLIDLRGVDAISRSFINNEFDFIGAASFSGRAGELRVASIAGRTVVQMDVTGDGRADHEIAFGGRVVLTAGDFIL